MGKRRALFDEMVSLALVTHLSPMFFNIHNSPCSKLLIFQLPLTGLVQGTPTLTYTVERLPSSSQDWFILEDDLSSGLQRPSTICWL